MKNGDGLCLLLGEPLFVSEEVGLNLKRGEEAAEIVSDELPKVVLFLLVNFR